MTSIERDVNLLNVVVDLPDVVVVGVVVVEVVVTVVVSGSAAQTTRYQ